MTNRGIETGRENRCDIVRGNTYTSNLHAKLFLDGRQLMYQGNRRKGIMINNTAHNGVVPVNDNDTTMIAGQYHLKWYQIKNSFPKDLFWGRNHQEQAIASTINNANIGTHGLSWNWGVFMLYPLWGFWNRCRWELLITSIFGWTVIPRVHCYHKHQNTLFRCLCLCA